MSEIIKYSLRENPARLDKAPTMGVPPLYFDTLEEAKAVQEKEFSAFGFGDDVIISPLTEEICKKELERMLIWFFYEHEFGLNASFADMCIFEESFNAKEHFALEAVKDWARDKIICSNRWCKADPNHGTNKKLCVIYDPMWIKCHLHHCNSKDVIWYFYSFFDQWFVQREHLMYGIKARNLI